MYIICTIYGIQVDQCKIWALLWTVLTRQYLITDSLLPIPTSKVWSPRCGWFSSNQNRFAAADVWKSAPRQRLISFTKRRDYGHFHAPAHGFWDPERSCKTNLFQGSTRSQAINRAATILEELPLQSVTFHVWCLIVGQSVGGNSVPVTPNSALKRSGDFPAVSSAGRGF